MRINGEKTRTDRAIDWFKDHKVFSIVILIFIIIIAIGNFTGALQNIKNFFFPTEQVIKIYLPGQEPKKCELDSLPQKPFKHKNSTKILIAVFEGGRKEAKEFGTDISMSIANRLDEYCKDSLNLSSEDIEVVRLNCFVQSHEDAREILDSLGGDIFIWGNNFCSPSSEKAKFCPKATLTKRISPLEARGERIEVKEQLAITDLDLPSLTAEKPYQLLNFIFGLHFYLRDKFKEAAVYFEKAGDEIYSEEKGIEYVYHYLAYTYQFLSKNDKALNYYEKSLKLFEESENRKGEGANLNNIGRLYHACGKYDQAIEYYQRSLKITEEVGNRQGEGVTLSNIGSVYDAWGKYDQAIEYYQKSLKITVEIGDRKQEGVSLNCIANVYYVWGNYDQAIEYYQRSLKIGEEVGDRQGEGVTLNNIGMVYYAWGKYDQATEYYQKSLKIFEGIGDRKNEGVTLNNIGEIYRVWGKYDQAIEYYQRSLKIKEEIGDRQGEGVTLNNIGIVYYAWGKYDQAIEYMSKSLKIFEEIGAAVEAKTVRENLKLVQEEKKMQK
jgi:tetratricopeptide (TPR) repeat protein